MAASNLPPLPKIEGDPEIMLDLYMHRSLTGDGNGAFTNDEYGNAARLRHIGEGVLRVVVMTHVYHERPMLTVDRMNTEATEYMSEATLSRWMDLYSLRNKIRVAPGTELSSASVATEFMYAFIGALYVRNGLQTVQSWISKLISPEAPPPQVPAGGVSMGDDSPPNYQHTPGQYPSSPPPPSQEPPPMPPMSGQPQFDGTGATAPPGGFRITLAMMNQTAAQRGFQVTYPATSQGPPHAPVWNATCCVNNVEYGQGTGKTQKIAKEEAAEQAWRRLGW